MLELCCKGVIPVRCIAFWSADRAESPKPTSWHSCCFAYYRNFRSFSCALLQYNYWQQNKTTSSHTRATAKHPTPLEEGMLFRFFAEVSQQHLHAQNEHLTSRSPGLFLLCYPNPCAQQALLEDGSADGFALLSALDRLSPGRVAEPP